MNEQNFLVLVYDSQSLDDVLRADVPFEALTVITPLSLFREKTDQFKSFSKTIPVKEYLSSAQLEVLALSLHQKRPFKGVIALHEVDILRAGYLRNYFNLPGQSLESARGFRQKTLMKSILKKHNIRVPAFQPLHSVLDAFEFGDQHSFPLILKPDLGTGSRGVHILQSQRQLQTLVKKKNLFPANQYLDWQMEEFVEGEMYHINGAVIHHDVVAVWPSHYPQQSIEMTQGRHASSVMLSSENSLTERLNTYAKQVLKALPTPRHAIFHLEVFVTSQQDIIFCEIASRIGGKGVRNSWLESFHMDLGKIFVEAQFYDKAYQFSNFPPLKPVVLTGEIWFPARQGILSAIAPTCPYDWVKEYQTFFAPGARVHKTQDINGCVGGTPLFIGANDAEMHHRLDEFVQWFESQTRWK